MDAVLVGITPSDNKSENLEINLLELIMQSLTISYIHVKTACACAYGCLLSAETPSRNFPQDSLPESVHRYVQ